MFNCASTVSICKNDSTDYFCDTIQDVITEYIYRISWINKYPFVRSKNRIIVQFMFGWISSLKRWSEELYEVRVWVLCHYFCPFGVETLGFCLFVMKPFKFGKESGNRLEASSGEKRSTAFLTQRISNGIYQRRRKRFWDNP